MNITEQREKQRTQAAHKYIESDAVAAGNEVLDNDRQLMPFKVKGQVVMAYSKKDAIIRWKHQKKGGKK